jgi:hypothetical protein
MQEPCQLRHGSILIALNSIECRKISLKKNNLIQKNY